MKSLNTTTQHTTTHTRNSSADETVNLNFLYDDIVHEQQNTIDLCINSATDRHGYVLERMFTKFSEIMQCTVVLIRISKSCKRTDSDGFLKKSADPDADLDSG